MNINFKRMKKPGTVTIPQFVNLLDILEEQLLFYNKDAFREYLEYEVGLDPLEAQYPELVNEELRFLYAANIVEILKELDGGRKENKWLLEAGFTRREAITLFN